MAGPGAAGRATRFITGAAAHTGPEIITETLQEGWGGLIQRPYAEDMARRFPGRGISGPSWGEIGQAMKQAAWQTFWGGASVGLFHPAAEFFKDPRGLSRMSPEQRAALVDQTLEIAEKRLALDGVKKDNLQLRANVKAATEEMRKHPEFAQNAEATAALLAGISGGEKTAYVPAKTLQSFMQEALEQPGADMETIQTEFLEPLGVTSEALMEALDNETDVRVDLNAAPQVMNHPLWDKVTAEITAEPASLARELEADLEALGPPPLILDRAGSDVTEETRNDFERRMIEAGRTKAEARRETEVSSRVASIISQVTGQDPNQLLRERIMFARAGEAEGAGAASYGQGMYRSQARHIQDFINEALANTSKKAKPFFILDNPYGRKIIEVSSDQAKHIDNKHPDFDDWELVPKVIEEGDQTPVGRNTVTHTDTVIYSLENNGEAVVVVAAPDVGGKGRKDKPTRTVILTAFRENSGAVNNWLAIKKAALSPSVEELQLNPRPNEQAIITGPEGGDSKIAKFDQEVNELLEKKATFEQSAFHGSPTKGITRMSTDFIGTGEGHQAFGWGLYAAGDKSLAEHYRKILTSAQVEKLNDKKFSGRTALKWYDHWSKQTYGLSPEKARPVFDRMAMLENLMIHWDFQGVLKEAAESEYAPEAVQWFKKTFEGKFENPGQLYKLDIPDDDVLLDWDKPLSEQPEKVKAALEKQFSLPSFDADFGTAGEFYQHRAERRGQKEVSLELNALGIKGIRYLDGTSRAKGEGSHNYVIFDDQAINILETYYQASEAGPRGRLDVLSDGSFLVNFTQAADASTPIHEAAHMFVELARQVLASSPDEVADWAAFEQVQGDLRKLADWAGQADPYGEWSTQAHEKLARGFETYLMEGKPPTEGLRGIFERMKAWLLDIYREIKNLDAPLNDEVREVFDRLVAADWELAMDPLREGAPEGLAPEVENALAKPRALAQEAREQAVARKRLAEVNRLRREWKKEGQALAKEVLSRKWIDSIRENGGISVDSLKALGYTPEGIQALAKRHPGLVSRKGKVGLDEIGQMHGFEYADDFYHALKDAPTQKEIIDGYVAEMEQLYADWAGEPPALTRAEINLMELEALAAQHRDNPAAAVEAIRKAQEQAEYRRQRAEERAARKSVEELLGMNSKEQIAALKAEIKKLQGNFQRGATEGYNWGAAIERAEAARALAEQADRFRAEQERKNEIKQALAYFGRLVGQKWAKLNRDGGILPEYHGQIKNLLAGFGMGRRVEGLPSLADFAAGLDADNAGLAIAEWIMAGERPAFRTGREKTGLRQLTYEQFQDVKNAVDNLVHLGREAQTVMVEGRRADFETTVKQAVETINQHHEVKAPATQKEIIEGGDKKRWRLLEAMKGFEAALLKIETIANVLGGGQDGNFIHQLLYDPVNRAHWKAQELNEAFLNGLKPLIEAAGGEKAMRRWRGEKVVIDGVPWTLTKEQTIVWFLNSGNEKNLKSLMGYDLNGDGKGVRPEQHQAIIDSLSREEKQFAQGLIDLMDNQMYPALNELTRRTTGLPLKKEGAIPIKTKDGVYRGGYWPLVFDKRLSGRAERLGARSEDMTRALSGASRYAPRSTRASSTIERRGATYKDLMPLLSLDVLARSVKENVHDLAYREATYGLKRLTGDRRIRDAIGGALGRERLDQIDMWLDNIIEQGKEKGRGRFGDVTLRLLRRNVGTAAMGLKATVFLSQVSGLFQSMQKVGPTRLAAAAAEYFGSWLTGGHGDLVNRMYELSPELAHRNAGDFDRDVYAQLAERSPFFKTGREKIENAAFKPISIMDQIVANVTWLAKFTEASRQGMNEAEAVWQANTAVRRTQGTASLKDLSFAQRGGGYSEMGKLFTMFGMFFSATHNLFWEQGQVSKMKWRSGDKLGAALGGAKSLVVMAFLPALFDAIVRNGLPEDEEDWENVGRGVISYLSGGIPIVKDAVEFEINKAAGGRLGFRPTAVQDALEDILFAPANVAEFMSEDGKPAAGDRLIKAGGYLFGLPSSQALTTKKGIEDWGDNEGLEALWRLLARNLKKK